MTSSPDCNHLAVKHQSAFFSMSPTCSSSAVPPPARLLLIRLVLHRGPCSIAQGFLDRRLWSRPARRVFSGLLAQNRHSFLQVLTFLISPGAITVDCILRYWLLTKYSATLTTSSPSYVPSVLCPSSLFLTLGDLRINGSASACSSPLFDTALVVRERRTSSWNSRCATSS